MSFFRIAAEQRDAERRKREFQEIEKALALTKRKFKQETTEVMLGVSLISFYRWTMEALMYFLLIFLWN
jgi:hypothetical protein